MRFRSLSIASAVLTGVSATVDLHSIPKGSTHGLPVVPGGYIVELDTATALGRRSGLTPHQALYDGLNKRGTTWNLRKEYNSDGIFVGAALNVAAQQDLVNLASISHVKSISPIYLHPRPIPAKSHVVSGPSDSALPPDTFSTHVMTGVDKLHAEGTYGKGVKVAIIDTGVDYLHPALGAGFGPGYKVSHGYDFVGDDYTGSNTPVPDNDPMDCAGHGTHVAGIVGANTNSYNFTGVAPQAEIGAYRVFGCDGSVSDDVLIDAITRAYQEGNDIITMSLGGAQGWSSAPSSVVSSRVAAAGRVVTIAAGNDGAYGMFYASAPGTGLDVISVASVENTQLQVQTVTLSNGHAPIAYYSLFPLPVPGSHPIYATSTDTTITNDACNPLPDSTPDLSNYVVLIRRGSCTFVTKLGNAAAKGAKYALIYNNVATPINIDAGNYTAAAISADDGAYLVSQFVAKTNLTISFPQTGGASTVPNPTGGLLSSFSTYSPPNDLHFKPSLAAPGGNILSTWPRNLGSYAVLSGTSMATPFVAGSAALYLQTRGKAKSTYTGTRYRFESTAVAVPSSHTDGDPLSTLAQAGAGLINVYDAIHGSTIVSTGELLLNDTTHLKPLQVVTIQNTSNKPQTYKLTHVPAGTTTSFDSDQWAIDYPVPLTTNYAKVTIVPNTLTVQPGGKGVFAATILPPSGVDPKVFPVYSGFINVASASDQVHVAYLGVAASMKNMKILDQTDLYFGVSLPLVADGEGNVQTDPTAYTFQGDDYPTLFFRLLGGTAAFHVDLVSANTTLATRSVAPSLGPLQIRKDVDFSSLAHPHTYKKPTSSRAKRDLGWFWGWLFPHRSQPGTYGKVPIVGQLVEWDYLSRNSDAGTADDLGYYTFALNTPTFANGTTIPVGSYKLLVRALKITGDPSAEADYEAWLSPTITVAKP